MAGVSAMAFFRTSLFVVRSGDRDVGVGPSGFLQIFLGAADRAVDRKRAAARAGSAASVTRAQSRPGVAPDERRDGQRERQIGNRIAHQLPRNERIFKLRLDFDPRVTEASADGIPHIASSKHQMEEFPPDLAHALFGALRDLLLRVNWVDPIILQVPADILRVLSGK